MTHAAASFLMDAATRTLAPGSCPSPLRILSVRPDSHRARSGRPAAGLFFSSLRTGQVARLLLSAFSRRPTPCCVRGVASLCARRLVPPALARLARAPSLTRRKQRVPVPRAGRNAILPPLNQIIHSRVAKRPTKSTAKGRAQSVESSSKRQGSRVPRPFPTASPSKTPGDDGRVRGEGTGGQRRALSSDGRVSTAPRKHQSPGDPRRPGP